MLPADSRRELGMNVKDNVGINFEGDSIVLKKYEPACVFCGSVDDVSEYRGKKICDRCMGELKG